MKPELRISIIEDYLGLEIAAASHRFSGTTHIYAALEELSAFASRIKGFPTSPQDERKYEFGSNEPGVAGGFASLRFHCVDGAGHAALQVMIEDDRAWYDPATARFTFNITAADLDRFLARLCDLEKERSGEATLPAV